jgi:hypothetical protein
MTETSFVPGPHPSHDWHAFDPSERPEARFCHRCEICTCHSPVASTEPCDFPKTDSERSS